MRFAQAAATPQRRFGWIDDLALPLATSVMEAQAVGLLLGLCAIILSGTARTAPLGAGGTALMLLGLAWWERLVHALGARGRAARFGTLLSIIGWLVVLTLAIVPSLSLLLQGQGIPQVTGAALVATWAWQRGVRRAQGQWEYEDVQDDFKVALGVVLATLVLTGLMAPHADLLVALAGDLPIFFLSGLLAVSLARLAVVRRQHATRQADPARLWLVALLSLVTVLVVAALGLEALISFSTLQQTLAALGPVGQGIGVLATWLLDALGRLLTPIFWFFTWLAHLLTNHQTTTAPSSVPVTGTPTPKPPTLPVQPTASISPVVIGIGTALFVAIIVVLVVLLGARALHRWFAGPPQDGIEEVREGIDPRAEMRQRRQQHAAAVASIAIDLDPRSVRARYREVLEAAQATETDLAHRLDETPAEYETRILAALRQRSAADPADVQIVQDLTCAYRAERYGALEIPPAERERLRAAVPGLIARLFPPAPTPGRRAEAQR
jgi:hypothetical protein